MVPVLFFLLLEASLRWMGYGPDLSLFTTEEIGGVRYHVMNPDVKHRYFSRVEFSPNTSPDYFLVPKPSGTFRIFILGGSSTVGFPYGYVGSFSTHLRNRLRRYVSAKPIEIINLGMTATNSYTALDIMGEIVDYEPDLIVAYDGHNEFYGALGIASAEGFAFRWVAQAYLKLIHVRTFQLLRSGIRGAIGIIGPSPGNDQSGTMMERLAKGKYVELGSPQYEKCLNHFRENMKEMKEIAKEYSVPLIFTTQVSNILDQAPFVSVESEDSAQTPELFRTADELWKRASFDSSLAIWEKASRLFPSRPDVWFGMARCLDTLERTHEARRAFIRARDLDLLRFRASSDFNDAIREVADPPIVTVVDMEKEFEMLSPDSIIGSNLILEHVHPNERGYFLMAGVYAEAIKEQGLIGGKKEWAELDSMNVEELWRSRPATEFDRIVANNRLTALLSGWPFATPAPAERMERQKGISEIARRYAEGHMTWEEAHVRAAEYYESRGFLDSAKLEYRALMDQLPRNVSAYLLRAQICLKLNEPDEAMETLSASLEVEETMFALRTIGSMLIDRGEYRRAIPYLDRARLAVLPHK